MFSHTYFAPTYFAPAYFAFGAPFAPLADRALYYTRDIAGLSQRRVVAVMDGIMPSRGQRARAVMPALTAIMPVRRSHGVLGGSAALVLGRRFGEGDFGDGSFGGGAI